MTVAPSSTGSPPNIAHNRSCHDGASPSICFVTRISLVNALDARKAPCAICPSLFLFLSFSWSCVVLIHTRSPPALVFIPRSGTEITGLKTVDRLRADPSHGQSGCFRQPNPPGVLSSILYTIWMRRRVEVVGIVGIVRSIRRVCKGTVIVYGPLRPQSQGSQKGTHVRAG